MALHSQAGRLLRIEAVDQVLDRQPQLGIALDHQAAAEEQRVRILLAARQQQEVAPAAADGHAGHAGIGETQALAVVGETPGQAEVAHFQPQPVTVQEIEGTLRQRLGEQAVGGPLQHRALQARAGPAPPAAGVGRRRAGHRFPESAQVHLITARSIPGRPCQYPLQPSTASGGVAPLRTRSKACTTSTMPSARGLRRSRSAPQSRSEA